MQRVKLEDWICREEGFSCIDRLQINALQLKRLNVLIEKYQKKGGIWADLPGNLENLSQLQDLPFTTAAMLQDCPGQFLQLSQAQVERVISQATSGTTGGAKRVFYSQKDLNRTVDFFAAGISEMLSSGEKCLIAFPFSGPSGLGDLIAKAVEKLGAVPVKAGFGSSFREMNALIQKEQPQTYIGFSAPLLSMKRLFPGVFPIQRALLSGDSCPRGVLDSLHMPCYPHYGSRETALGGAVTCSAFEGMHLRENHIIPEIIDPSGQVLPDGQFGELVITTIGMEAMPLLRYRTGDRTRILPTPCPCGGITRRLDRVVRMESGPVSMEALDNAIFPISQVVDFRAFLGNSLDLQVSVLEEGIQPRILSAVKTVYPHLSVTVSCRIASADDRPAYPGKRHILKAEGCHA